MGAKSTKVVQGSSAQAGANAENISSTFENKSGRIACLLDALPSLAPSLVQLVHEYEYVVCVHVLDGLHHTHTRYDPQVSQWIRVNNSYSPRLNSTAVVLQGYMYAIGGEDKDPGRPVSNVDRYDPNLNEWISVSPMLFKRQAACAVTVGSKLYVMGGFDGLSRLDTMEQYDPARREWTQLPSMSISRGPSLAAVEYGKCIYVFGGGNSLKKVEKFDVELNQWTEVASMKRPRYALAAVALGQFIYALGGDDCQFALAECERYDPETDTWSDIPSMLSSRQNFAAVVLGSRVYCMGGVDAASPMKEKVEMFDTISQQWSFADQMPTQTSRLAAVCL